MALLRKYPLLLLAAMGMAAMGALLTTTIASARPSQIDNVSISLKPASSGTYYVNSELADSHQVSLLVDTGSSYTIFDHLTLDRLALLGAASYKLNIVGVMADGSEKTAKVYHLNKLRAGDCLITDIDVVAFTSKATFVLGINALKQLSPFAFDISDNSLTASCKKYY